eukprot:2965091-Pleurochrysis_carterae.AAC.2
MHDPAQLLDGVKFHRSAPRACDRPGPGRPTRQRRTGHLASCGWQEQRHQIAAPRGRCMHDDMHPPSRTFGRSAHGPR